MEQGKKMSRKDQSKPPGKSGQRSRKGERSKKPDSQRSLAPVQLQSPDQDQPIQPVPEQAESPEVLQQPTVAEQIDTAAATPTAAPEPPEPQPTAAPAPAEPAPVSLQTIANAYRDYTRKSFEEFGSYFEQLSGARSLDKAMTVQTEFVKRAYETSVTESQRIYELHNRLARQTYQPFQGLVGKAPDTHGKS
jgi:hypothetical protein